jgi:hypothetical protein
MREVIVMVRDDLDHSLDADIEVRLGVDGLVYCLDLTTEHAERSRAELAAWLSASHEVVKDKRRPRDKSTVADRLGSKSGSAPKPAPTPRVSPSSAASAPDHRAGSSPAATGMRCG